MLVTCLIVMIVILLMYQRWKNRDIYKLGRELNSGVWTLPFLGHSYLFLGNSETSMKAFQTLGRDALKNNNGLSSMWHGNYLYTMVADPISAEYVLKTCLQKDEIVMLLTLFFGSGSILAPVSRWRPRRKLLVSTLGAKNVKQFLPIFSEQSQVIVEQLGGVAGKGIVSAWKYYTALTMDTITESALGYKLYAQKDSGHKFLKSIEAGLEFCAKRVCAPWLHSDRVCCNMPGFKKVMEMKNYMWGFVAELVDASRKAMQKKEEDGKMTEQDISPKSFLELMMRYSEGTGKGGSCTDMEIIEEVVILIVAGNDTTAVAMSFVTLMLARHPEVQDRVYEEIQEVLGDSDREVTMEDILRLKYLDAVIRETLRLYPPVPLTARKVEQETVLPSGLKLPPGTGVMVNVWAIHRNPRYWGEDAELFRPERFIDLDLENPAAFMPFSNGPRNCIGYQFAMIAMKTVLSHILKHYKILPASDNNTKDPPLRLKFDIMMKDVDNFPIRFEHRKKK
ncbi:cytochrome P450 4d8-like [Anticarsia gemmatalis]|uniref:cytochrome P450 4d8-like n=1 Tax=Anticarsia gemmatalis TaxID=129554 RepID=UPI003F76CF53